MPATAVAYKMRNRCFLLAVLMLFCGFALATSTLAAETASTQPEHEGVSLKPQMLVHFGGGFGITNSMLVTWIVAAGIIILAQTAMRNPKPIPGRRQNFWEWMVEGLYTFLENIIGRDLVRKGFWFYATIFIFILFVNWFGLNPRNRNNRLGSLRPLGKFPCRSAHCYAVATRI
jgi:F-type H+-transporting ATPase subunit a